MKFFTSVSNQITQDIQLTQYQDLIFFCKQSENYHKKIHIHNYEVINLNSNRNI
jgi:hypothetical protein